MTYLFQLTGTARCFKGACFFEPMRVHQPDALYHGCWSWLAEQVCPEGVVAQHGYYREIADCEQVRLAYVAASQKGSKA